MKNGFEGQFESLIRRRFQEREKHFRGRLVEVKQEHNRRGILMSSITVVAMHAELEREFKESATECVKAVVYVMANRPTALLVPRKQKVRRVCSDALSERKAVLEATFQGASASILTSLSNTGLTAPYRSLSDSVVQLQFKNACVELRTKQRELFWLKLNRMLKLLPFLKLRALLLVAVVAGLSYLGRVEIVEVWKSMRDRVVGPAHDAGESTEKAGPIGTGRRLEAGGGPRIRER